MTRAPSPRAPAPSFRRPGMIGEGYHESRRCSRDTYPETCITKYTSIPRRTPTMRAPSPRVPAPSSLRPGSPRPLIAISELVPCESRRYVFRVAGSARCAQSGDTTPCRMTVWEYNPACTRGCIPRRSASREGRFVLIAICQGP